jgi:hypothetical protein
MEARRPLTRTAAASVCRTRRRRMPLTRMS